jgi:Tol biopolymer transport system component
VWLVAADGSNARNLTGNSFSYAHWSQDGQRLLMIGDHEGASDPPHVGWDVDPVTGQMRLIPYPDTDLTVICYRWSPDRTRVACEAWNDAVDNDPRQGIYTLRASDGQDFTPLYWQGPGQVGEGTLNGYSPDGTTFLFNRQDSDDDQGLYLAAVDGSWVRRLTPPSLLVSSTEDMGGDFSPDGSRIVFSAQVDNQHRRSLWTVRPDGSGLERVRVQLAGKSCGGKFGVRTIGCSDPTWSPDGKWIAYQLNSVNPTEIHVSRVDGSDDRLLVTGGEQPDWGGTSS